MGEQSGDQLRARALLAARHAERLYPGPLGRLVALELAVHAERDPAGGSGLAESVIAEVLDHGPRRALLRSSELHGGPRRVT